METFIVNFFFITILHILFFNFEKRGGFMKIFTTSLANTITIYSFSTPFFSLLCQNDSSREIFSLSTSLYYLITN